MGGRSVMIRISPGWSVVPLAATLAEVSPQIDAFVASQHPAENE